MSTENKGGGKPPLCIIGTASSAGMAPYEAKDENGNYIYEVWCVGTAPTKPDVLRYDRVFEMHPKRYWGQLPVMTRYSDLKCPVYMQDHYDEIPNSVKYPYKEVREKFYLDCMGEHLYVTNTITWMILLALHEGYTDLHIYGVHMAHETEYAYQRSSLSWVLGIIHGWIMDGKPYKVYIPEESSLMHAEYEYGFGEPTKQMQYVQQRIAGMKAGIQEARQEIEGKKISIYRTEGGISEAQNIYDKLAGFK